MRSAPVAMATTNSSEESKDAAQPQKSGLPSMKMCPKLQAFYDRHGIVGAEALVLGGAKEHPHSLRFVRLNPRHDKEETVCLLKAELGDKDNCLMPIPWLDECFGFYAIPGKFSLAQSYVFRSGRVYGMDVSSGAAVAALLSNQRGIRNVRVLDLCCSPGLKLCMTADLLHPSSTVVGVDISEERLAVCKSIVKKYHVDSDTSGRAASADDFPSGARIRLYCADGTKFGSEPDPELVFDSVAAIEDQKVAGKRKRMNKSARARERKRLKQLSSLERKDSCEVVGDSQGQPLTGEPFDCVLVDAECSTDGSLKHVQQRALKAGGGDNAFVSNPTLTDPEQLASLVELQKGLISSAFGLLKPGGVLVYSTCSLSTDQNEDVCEWLLKNEKDSFIIPVEFPMAKGNLVVSGSLEGTVRFHPGVTRSSPEDGPSFLVGGGFFLAKLGKRNAATESEPKRIQRL